MSCSITLLFHETGPLTRPGARLSAPLLQPPPAHCVCVAGGVYMHKQPYLDLYVGGALTHCGSQTQLFGMRFELCFVSLMYLKVKDAVAFTLSLFKLHRLRCYILQLPSGATPDHVSDFITQIYLFEVKNPKVGCLFSISC